MIPEKYQFVQNTVANILEAGALIVFHNMLMDPCQAYSGFMSNGAISLPRE